MSNKQETLEQAAENYIQSKNPQWTPYHRQSFTDGAKWQAAKMYSEEEAYDLLVRYSKECCGAPWFEVDEVWFNINKK